MQKLTITVEYTENGWWTAKADDPEHHWGNGDTMEEAVTHLARRMQAALVHRYYMPENSLE